MIVKISKLNKTGKFSSISQDKNFQYGDQGQNVNIIFGFNGSGKTTVSNAISFFGNNSFISEEEKQEIYDDLKNGSDSIVELKLQNNSTIKYPANKSHSKEIYIFNSNFVATHVFNGTKGKLKTFSNIGAELKNKQIEKINEQLETVNKEKDSLDAENKALDKKHEDITTTISKKFRDTLTDKNKRISSQNLTTSVLPSETIEKLEKQIEQLSVDYELSKKQTELVSDLEEIRKMNFASKASIDFDVIDELLSKNVQQLSKDALEKKIREVQNLFEDDLHKQSAEKWLRYGKDILKRIGIESKQMCPICDTDITHKFNSLLVDYEGYFDEAYENFVTDLNGAIEKIDEVLELINQYELDANNLEKIHSKYNKLLTDYSFKQFQFESIKKNLKELRRRCQSKKDSIQEMFIKPEKMDSNMIALNSAIITFQALNKNVLDVLDSKKLSTNEIEDKIRQTYRDIILLEFDKSDKTGALKKHKTNCIRIGEIANTEVPQLQKDLATELSKIKVESKSISKYLGKMGIDHFDIDINEDASDENIVIRFKNGEKNKLKHSLSDGEKTTLAFAYFLSKYENEINTDSRVRQSVVIIDDPISSLDENRLYSTAYLIHNNFANVKQLIVMSHNFLFLKYFCSMSRKAECFFLDQNTDTISELPEELINFETPYFYMLKNITEFLDDDNKDVTYNDVKKHIPNFVRRVLETFLSFKFSRLVNKDGGYRSPGLPEFDDSIEQTDFAEDFKNDVKKKIAEINNICDLHSHGNLHHTQEGFYISEIDLRTLARNTIYIIEQMDNLHKTSFVNKK